MYSFIYKLEKNNHEELNCYLALHDKNLQKQAFMLGFCVGLIIAIIILILFTINIFTVLIAVSALVLSIMFFPKLYWNIIFKRIKTLIDKNNYTYSDVEVTFDENKIKTSEFKIDYSNIVNFDMTKSNLLIFYNKDSLTNSLVIPLSSISNLDDFMKFLGGKCNHE